jgi:hypothetical protein
VKNRFQILPFKFNLQRYNENLGETVTVLKHALASGGGGGGGGGGRAGTFHHVILQSKHPLTTAGMTVFCSRNIH